MLPDVVWKIRGGGVEESLERVLGMTPTRELVDALADIIPIAQLLLIVPFFTNPDIEGLQRKVMQFLIDSFHRLKVEVKDGRGQDEKDVSLVNVMLDALNGNIISGLPKDDLSKILEAVSAFVKEVNNSASAKMEYISEQNGLDAVCTAIHTTLQPNLPERKLEARKIRNNPGSYVRSMMSMMSVPFMKTAKVTMEIIENPDPVTVSPSRVEDFRKLFDSLAIAVLLLGKRAPGDVDPTYRLLNALQAYEVKFKKQ